MSKLFIFIVHVEKKHRENLNIYFKIFEAAEGSVAVMKCEDDCASDGGRGMNFKLHTSQSRIWDLYRVSKSNAGM
jgi:hypothetical protein